MKSFLSNLHTRRGGKLFRKKMKKTIFFFFNKVKNTKVIYKFFFTAPLCQLVVRAFHASSAHAKDTQTSLIGMREAPDDETEVK